MKKHALERVAAALVAGNLVAVASPAVAQRQTTFLDLTAGLGYSTNPFLRVDDGNGSPSLRLSAFGNHSWQNERGATSLTGFVENSTYFDDHGSKPIFDLGASTSRQASENVRLYGNLNFSGDIGAQLSNRFVSVPLEPVVPDPTAPLPPPNLVDPDLFAFSNRHYRLNGQVGLSVRASERDTMTFSGGAQRVWFTGPFVDDYTNLFGSAAWDRQLSERTAAGLRLNLNRTAYDGTDNNVLVVNPEITARTQLSENWDASGAIGLTFARVTRDDVKDWSTNFSLSGNMCRTSETERLCARVARATQTSAIEDLVTNTSLGVDWFKRLDEKQTIQLSGNAVRYASEDILGDSLNSTYFSFAGNYDRRVNHRFSAGASLGARFLRNEGPDADTDLNGTVYLRYRLGDLG